MADVLHTADVHLTADAPERRTALEAVLERAEEEAVDVVTIGGDLFDRPDDVESLRPTLRNELFADRPFEILLIPGNHDVAAFRGDVFFGNSCTVLHTDPFEHWTNEAETLRITGLPYRERPDDELLLALQDREPFDGVEVLLLHCSLDAPIGTDAGEEGHSRYFPVSEPLLRELGFEYYLAGHYHNPNKVVFEDGAVFAYPGTPASTRRSETGRRRVSLLTAGAGIEFSSIPTFHYSRLERTVTPGGEADLLEDVRAWVESQAIESADASIHVDGFTEREEDVFHEQLTEAASPIPVRNETRSVRHVLSRPLFRSFEEILETQEWDADTTDAVRERTLEVFSQLAARGDI